MPGNHFADVLKTTNLDALRGSLRRQMPAGPLRDYYLWGLDPAQPDHDRFLQAVGVAQLTRLTATLVDGLVDDARTHKACELLARLTVYQTYEIISDNLELGLFGPLGRGGTDGGDQPPRDRPDPSAVARRRLLRSFTTAMTVRLRGGGRTAAMVLAPERRRASRVSLLEQSLATRSHRALTGRSADRRGGEPVEWDLWPALVANIEAGVDVAATVAGTPLGDLVRDGLIQRYRAINRTLSDHHLSRIELAALGTHTVLVVPTLGYCLAVIADLADPLPGLAEASADGTLGEALYDAALVVRLLNDVGTALLRLGRDARQQALRRLRIAAVGTGDPAAALTGPRFTRLAKDLTHGEFNLCLYAARRATDPAAAMDALATDLDYFARLYALHRERLGEALDRLTIRLGDPRPATLVRRFVRFHTDLYAHDYADAAGEYAI